MNINIPNILKPGEGVSVEFKRAKNKPPESLFETLCAFLNRNGGNVLLGVLDNGSVEGFEYYAIKGGLETIKRDKPVLLISVYHTGKDFFEIPPMIKQCVPEYTFSIVNTCPTDIQEKILVGACNTVI
ncbi:MAG: putative DNA binding domain-containing protein [Prevotellaceae bacterium]|jgi:hypothetical protein|nr:putative DNA binding domain-containing protein [Prevotellaceae bacterium]